MNDTRSIALYVRVSTGHQIDKDSLPFQKKELSNYCKHFLHRDDFEIFEDAGKSGKNTKRPAFQRMLKKIQRDEISHVIVYKIDRVSRNLVDFSIMYDTFKKHNVTFISLNEQFDTSSAIGEAILKIILVFAELERKMTSERVKAVMLNRASNALWNGARVPYGWTWDVKESKPVPHPTESIGLKLIYDLYESTKSTGYVTKYLNNNDVPTKRGGEWTTKTVTDIIRNPLNKGDYRYNYRGASRGKKNSPDEVVYLTGIYEQQISPEQWDNCNRIMDHNASKMNIGGASHMSPLNHVFAQLLQCGLCGSGFQVAATDKRRASGFVPTLYKCAAHNKKFTCSAPLASDVKLGPFIFNYISNMVYAASCRSEIKSMDELEAILLKGKPFEKVYGLESQSLRDTLEQLRCGSSGSTLSLVCESGRNASNSTIEFNLNATRKELDKASRALERLTTLYLYDDEAMPEKEYLSRRGELQIRITQLTNEIAELESSNFTVDTEFLSTAAAFLLTHELESGEFINYSQLAPMVGNEILKEFVNLVIDHIVVVNALPTEIVFKSGLVNKFIYRE